MDLRKLEQTIDKYHLYKRKRQINNTYQRRERYGTLLPLIVICQVLLSAQGLF